MKINPELGNVINLVKKDESYQKKTQEKSELKDQVADIITVENKQASGSRVETVEQAKNLLSDVTNEMEKYSVGLYNINNQRISSLIS